MSSSLMVSLMMALISASLLNLFIRAAWLYVALCVAGVVLFSLYLIFDLQVRDSTGNWAGLGGGELDVGGLRGVDQVAVGWQW